MSNSTSSGSLHLDVTVLSHTLTTAQKLSIKNALLKVKLQEHLPAIHFWGRIQGASADYFLALATDVGQNITKKFYWRSGEHTRRMLAGGRSGAEKSATAQCEMRG
jgi:hypothetical protein